MSGKRPTNRSRDAAPRPPIAISDAAGEPRRTHDAFTPRAGARPSRLVRCRATATARPVAALQGWSRPRLPKSRADTVTGAGFGVGTEILVVRNPRREMPVRPVGRPMGRAGARHEEGDIAVHGRDSSHGYGRKLRRGRISDSLRASKVQPVSEG